MPIATRRLKSAQRRAAPQPELGGAHISVASLIRLAHQLESFWPCRTRTRHLSGATRPHLSRTTSRRHGMLRPWRYVADHTRIRQYDPNYGTYFYINPTTDPVTTSWTRPGLPEGEVHPEQAQALYDARQAPGGLGGPSGGGHAAEFLNSGSTADPVPSYTPAPIGENNGDHQGQGQAIQAGDGERGLGSMVAGMMGKMGGQQGYNNQQGYNQQGYNVRVSRRLPPSF